MPFERPVASALRRLIRTERQLFRGDVEARRTARAMNRRILYEVAPRKDGTLGRADDSAVALAILDQTSAYLKRNVVRATLNMKGSWEVEITKDTELGDNESINNVSRAPSAISGASSQPTSSAGVGPLKPSLSLRAPATSVVVPEEPQPDLSPEEIQRVENYLHGKDDSSPPPMNLLKAYQHRLDRMSELSGATAALINPPLSAKYHTGFVRPWDEYQAEIDVAKGQLYQPFAPLPAFFIATVTSFTLFYFFYPQILRNFTRNYELSSSR